MRAIVLGSGTSQGVPMIGCNCPVCTSTDPRDSRTRSSIVVEEGDYRLLVDSTPDMRIQCVREGIDRIDAILYTHAHADHIMGSDDLRRFCDINGGTLDVYASPATLARLRHVFDYAFDPANTIRGYYHPVPHEITETFELGPFRITPLPVPHGSITTYGYLFETGGRPHLAYISDCASLPPEIAGIIHGIPVLIIDGLRDAPHRSHMSFQDAIRAGQSVQAGATYITHLTHEKSHVQREKEVPEGCHIAYDGLRLDFA